MNQATTEQRNPEWFAARIGRLTGSRIGSVLGLNPWNSRADVLREMVREFAGAEKEFTGNIATEYGTSHEAEALSEYEAVTGHIVDEVGLVVHPVYDWLAASPDGLVDDERGLEIKCPFSGNLKPVEDQPHYQAQIQLCMAVTGRKVWDYFSWSPSDYRLQEVHFDEDWLPGHMSDLQDFMAEYQAALDIPESENPHLQPLERDMSADEQWANHAAEYLQVDSEMKALKKRQETIKKALIKMASGKKSKGCGLQAYPTIRQGSVDTDALAKDAGLNPDNYRKESSTSWTVRIGK